MTHLGSAALMRIVDFYQRYLPVWHASYIRRLAALDYSRYQDLEEVEQHAKLFLDVYALELADDEYYDLARRLALEVAEYDQRRAADEELGEGIAARSAG
jgi:hypothetical protein